MDGHQRIGLREAGQRANHPEPVQDGMETGLAPGRDRVRHAATDFAAEHRPIGLLVGGEDEDEAGRRVPAVERLERVHQDRFSLEGDELLRQRAAHAEATAAGDDNHVAVHASSSSNTFLTSSSTL